MTICRGDDIMAENLEKLTLKILIIESKII